MKTNKNVMALTLSLGILSPQYNSATTNEPTAQQVNQAIEHAQKTFPATENSTSEHNKLNPTEKALLASIVQNNQKTITLENAAAILANNIDQARKALTPGEIEALTTLISTVVNSALEEIQVLKNHEITKEKAYEILQACSNSLTIGSTFNLNGTTYTIAAPKSKNTIIYNQVRPNLAEKITLENAATILEKNIEQARTLLTSAELETLTNLVYEIVNAGIEEIQVIKNHEISKEKALELLQNSANNLNIGGKFSLNETTYNITAPRNKSKNK